MWVVGLQFLFWCAGGLYFSLLDIHFIHGESLVTSPSEVNISQVNYGFAEVLRDYPDAKHIKLYALKGQPYIQFVKKDNDNASSKRVIDASNGQNLELIDETKAIALALDAYSGSEKVTKSQLLSQNPPFELWSGHLPVWRIDFDDINAPTLYVSQTTGEVVTKRHHWWRIFDVFWRLHIMDVLEGENVKNPLLTVAASLAMITTLAGAILTWYLVVLPRFKYKSSVANKRKTRFFQRWHRRSSVAVALQMVIWIATGLYFNLMDSQWYSTHHHRAEPADIQCPHESPEFRPVPLKQLTLPQAPLYLELKSNSLGCYILVHYNKVFHQYQPMQASSFDAYTGLELGSLDNSDALTLAQNSYSGPGEITNLSLLAGGESSNKKQQNPVWKVDFSDEADTSVYVHSLTRQVIRHENQQSRFHQLMFTLHFMDYFGTGGFNHWLLKLFGLMALLLTGTGIYWLVVRT